MSIFAALQVDRTRQAFVTIQRAAGDARNFLVIDDGLAILYYGDHASYQRDVEGLPLAGLARQFGRWRRNP